MIDDADTTNATPDPDDHAARLRAQIDAATARRAGYRAAAAETVARGGPVRPTDEELGIIKTDDTASRIAADAAQEIRSRLSRLMSRFGEAGRSRTDGPAAAPLASRLRHEVVSPSQGWTRAKGGSPDAADDRNHGAGGA